MSQHLYIESTDDTPEVRIDFLKGFLSISGISRPENARLFVDTILNWIESHKKELTSKLTCDFKFTYINTASQKSVYEILKKINGLYNDGHPVIINWRYKSIDDEMYETGEDFSVIFDMPFNFIPYK